MVNRLRPAPFHRTFDIAEENNRFIEVDQQRHSWRDGEAVIFDETYVHWAENKSDHTRIILFCDIERPMKWRWAQAVNHWVGTTLMHQCCPDPVVNRLRPAPFHRTFDIAEENNPRVIRFILRPVHVSFIKDDSLTVTPAVALLVNLYKAIILFCDIERPMKWRWAQAVNHWVGTTLMSAASSPNDDNDRTGGINRIFKYVHPDRAA